MADPHEPSHRRPSRWWYLVAVVVMSGLCFLLWRSGDRQLDYSEFRRLVAQGRVVGTVHVGEQLIRGEMRDGDATVEFGTVPPPGADVAALLETAKVDYTGAVDGGLVNWLPWLLVPLVIGFLFWVLVLRGQGGASFSALHFGRHRAHIHAETDTLVTFADVAGVDEAVEEVKEVVEFLRAPERFQELGGRVPKGVLLVGMPGTGKTLLARAVAGAAGVPFLSISGADFVEMFVGVGASRVRDLFARAKELSPCIVFIDELDAIGKARSATSGASEEREQTLNQMLVEMDGFEASRGVIVLAATNRPEVLDQALLRPGRFDRQVVVDRPDVRGRLEILRLHTRNIKLGRNVDLAVIARRTPGFTGADLATLVNESALLAARRRRDQVGMALIEEAIDRVMAGLERRSRLISPREKMVFAVHETGHALAACLLERADPLHKVSVIPRGAGIGGMTLQLPREDRTLLTRDELLDRIGVLLGGRIAEQLIFKEISTGATNDLQRVTDIAFRMVVDYGMSDKIGPIRLGDPRTTAFLPARDGERPVSDETAREIDLEVRHLVQEQEARVTALLEPRKRHLAAIARVLRDRETLDAPTFERLLNTPLRRRQPSEEPSV